MPDTNAESAVDGDWTELKGLLSKDFDTYKIDELIASTSLDFALDTAKVFKKNIEQAIDLAARPFSMSIEPYASGVRESLA